MKETTLFILGGLFALFGLGGLFVASRAEEGAAYWAGLGFFAFCILLVFALISESGKNHS